jgi:hypothetical protein
MKKSNLRTVFGTRLRLLFAIESGRRCRGEKRDLVRDLLTSSAFSDTSLPKGSVSHDYQPILRIRSRIIAL